MCWIAETSPNSGSHEELLKNHGLYEQLWNAQQALENYAKDGDTE